MDNLGNRTSVTKRDTAVDTYALDSATNRYAATTAGALIWQRRNLL